MPTPVSRPTNYAVPFANSGAKNAIPTAATGTGKASFTEGFPAVTMMPIVAGGVPPEGKDFNGILYDITTHTIWVNAGGQYQFDAALSTAIGGYPKGMVLQNNAGTSSYVSAVDNNTTDFNTTPASIGTLWLPYAGAALLNGYATQAQVQNNSLGYAAGGGVANAYTATFTPAVTARTDGMILTFQATAANTGASTFNPNGLGAKPIVGGAHSALQGGEITNGGKVELMWHAGLDSWVLLGCTGGAMQVGTATQSQQAVTKAQLDAAATTDSKLYYFSQF